MKNYCGYTRKLLGKYMQGHLFKYEQVRIARHLNACPVCRSEYQTLKKVADTKQLLNDIIPPDGLRGRMKINMFGLGKLKLLIYRPVWLAAIIGVGVLIYLNLIPHRDIEIENIEKSIPANIASMPTATVVSAQGVAQDTGIRQDSNPTEGSSAAGSAESPLVITIIAENEQDAIQIINEIMKGHDQLETAAFSDSVRQISGSLIAKELQTVLKRIESAGKVSYSRKRMQAYPTERPISFVMKMKPALIDKEPLSSSTAAEYKSGEATAGMPASAPTKSAH